MHEAATHSRLLVVDDDDDDSDGVADRLQQQQVPGDDLLEYVIAAGKGYVHVTTLGALRVLQDGSPVALPLVLREKELPASLTLQALGPSQNGHPLVLLLTRGQQVERIAFHAVELSILDARNRPLSAARDALSLSHRITNDRSLPRGNGYTTESPDPANVRVQIDDVQTQGKHVKARLEAWNAAGTQLGHAIEVNLSRAGAGSPFRSPFIRLVSDEVDRTARGVAGQVLKVALRDRVRLVYETGLGQATHELRVGRPGDESGPLAARQAMLRVVVLRTEIDGPPVIGVDDASALQIVRDEVAIANEVWLQCLLTFGPPTEVAVQIADPPGPTLISIGDGDGLPARGGSVSFRIDGQMLPPVEIPAGAMPQDTALRIAAAVRTLGYSPMVTVNPPAVFGAGPSADVLIRTRAGAFVRVERIDGVPLTTDRQQSIRIGSVDLGDGLEEFDNMIAQSGTLEERTLIKALSDDDPSTIDLFIVNRFTHGTRQGEAFIPASSGPIVGSVVLDRNGLRQRKTAWTMAHELGHVLLNQPLHPDNVGADVPMLLMDSDNNRGTVHGPKRLLPAECQRVRYASGVRAHPSLLFPYDARPSSTGAPPSRSAKAVTH